MEFLIRYKWILIGIGVAVAGFFWYASSGTSAPADILTTETAGGSANSADKDLVETLLTLRSVTLSGTILSDPVFNALKDFGTQIVPEPIGRPDPFAPLRSAAAQSASAGSKGAQLFNPGAR